MSEISTEHKNLSSKDYICHIAYNRDYTRYIY